MDRDNRSRRIDFKREKLNRGSDRRRNVRAEDTGAHHDLIQVQFDDRAARVIRLFRMVRVVRAGFPITTRHRTLNRIVVAAAVERA